MGPDESVIRVPLAETRRTRGNRSRSIGRLTADNQRAYTRAQAYLLPDSRFCFLSPRPGVEIVCLAYAKQRISLDADEVLTCLSDDVIFKLLFYCKDIDTFFMSTLQGVPEFIGQTLRACTNSSVN
ncbi:hypothetical protein HNY73_012928 [Argiope bruennichi]|uniref:Uncharacterized protein n=1 Tax=Argiope bruennichi TaxID=94029 RepID=A0A8T0F101_ARGBR|nr:hypothetical protein HNY73_012928 [Argiope bruennichi]